MKTLINNHKCVVSIFLALSIVFGVNFTGNADVTPVKDRTPQIRDAIVAAVPNVNNAADVTAAHLNAITSLNLRGKGISVLKTDDFSGLTALTSLNLYNNRLSNLPDGIFKGLTSLTTIRLSKNTVDPLPFTVSLEKVAEGQFKAVAPAGALFNIVLPIKVSNGSITGDTTTLTIPHGSVESSTLTVTRTAGTTAHVKVNIDTLPSLPRNHFGYALIKSDTLPLTIISGTNTAPVFTDGANTTRSITENTPTGQHIGTAVAATDAENDTLTYTLSGTDASAFDIDSTTGQLRTKAALDYENKNAYTVTITVSDGNLTDTITVTIKITDVHEVVDPPPNSAPVFTEGSSTTRFIAENTVTGQNIGDAVTATDADGHLLTYSLSGTDAASFSIVSASGQLQTRATLDYEIKTSYAVTITASDGSLTDSVAVTINVTDVDETTIGARFVPVADRTPEVRDAIVAAVPNVSNADDVTQAHVAAIRDLNLRNVGIIALKADDFSGMTALTSLNLFNNQLSSLPPGIFDGITSLTTVRLGQNAVDPLPFIVSLEKVGSGAFKAVAPAGALFDIVLPITVTNGSVTGGAATLTIPHGSMESDTLAVTRTAGTTKHVTVDIGTFPSLPRNHYGYALVKSDNLPLVIDRGPNTVPVFSDSTTTTRSVAENSARGVNIGAPVSATDADGDMLTYSLSGIDASTFSINSSSGQLQTREVLDYETKTSYSVSVTVSDSYGGSDSITVRINVTDVQENRAPMFTEGVSTTRTVAENTEAGSNIGDVVSATDQDANDTLTYTLSGIDAAAFDIDSTSGQIKTKASLDYETKNTYSVSLTVSDGLATDTIAVTISVTDIDENRAPVFTEGGTATRSVAENTGADLNIGTAVTATDADNDTLTYTLGGTDAEAFSIDGTTGQIKTKAALDYETKNTYFITLTVSDELATDTIAVTINVTDIDENRAPVFTDGDSATRTVVENVPTGTNIGNAITATDPDNDTLTYSLGGQDAGVFGIDTTTGQLRTNEALDYETKSIYSVSVTASDSKLTTTITVTINITDVDELPDQVTEVKGASTNNAPVFTDGSSTTRSVAENTGSGVDIGTPIAATDADGDTLIYTLGGTDAAAFSINSTNGQLRTDVALDYETKSVYAVSVTVSDGTLADTIAVTINVTDVDELPDQVVAVKGVSANNAPVFTDGSSTSRSVAENTGSGVDIGSAVAATDADGDTLTYTLGGTDVAAFSINSTNGQLQTSAALDYETETSYSVTVDVSDGNGGSDSITVIINVTDVEEPVEQPLTPPASEGTQQPSTPPVQSPVEPNHAPVFSDGSSTTRNISENTDSGVSIGTPVSATDVDNDNLIYTLSGTDEASFSIVSTSGQLRTQAALDYENKNSYTVTVSVSDGNGGSDSITVTIDVTDVDERARQVSNSAPVFTDGDSATRTIAENTVSGIDIGSPIAATDPDTDDTLTYTLGGTDAASFSVVSTSGQLQTNAALDYETKKAYSVTVSVIDGKGGSDTITVTINITDVNETPANNAPEFTEGTSTTRLVAESTASGINIGSAVSATDADDDTLIYSLGGTDASSFSIDTATGQLQTKSALDYDTQNSYSVTVSVSDGNGGSDSITVTINVTDLVGGSIMSTNITTCSIIHKGGDVYDVTIEGTLTASQSVRHLTVYGYVNGGSQVGTDSIGFLDAGETVNFRITGTWTHDGSTSQRCFTIQSYQKVSSVGNNAPAVQSVPSGTNLLPNYPNPFNPETWIPYQLAKPAEVTLTIYNMRGVVVRTIALGHQAAGVYTSRSRAIHWDGRNMFGEKVATGLYFYTLAAGDFTATRKMLIRK